MPSTDALLSMDQFQALLANLVEQGRTKSVVEISGGETLDSTKFTPCDSMTTAPVNLITSATVAGILPSQDLSRFVDHSDRTLLNFPHPGDCPFKRISVLLGSPSVRGELLRLKGEQQEWENSTLKRRERLLERQEAEKGKLDVRHVLEVAKGSQKPAAEIKREVNDLNHKHCLELVNFDKSVLEALDALAEAQFRVLKQLGLISVKDFDKSREAYRLLLQLLECLNVY